MHQLFYSPGGGRGEIIFFCNHIYIFWFTSLCKHFIESFLKFKKKKLLQKVKKKLKGTAEAQTPVRGSVLLMSNLGVIPLRHRA